MPIIPLTTPSPLLYFPLNHIHFIVHGLSSSSSSSVDALQLQKLSLIFTLLLVRSDSTLPLDIREMRTRRGLCYETSIEDSCAVTERRKDTSAGDVEFRRKRRRVSHYSGCDSFDSLPDDLVLYILARLAASARRPSDFVSVLMTCVIWVSSNDSFIFSVRSRVSVSSS